MIGRMASYSKQALMLICCITLLFGVVIPAIFTGISQMLFHHAANGSLIERDGKVIGSELIGQSFTSPRYFWGRLSATTPPYNPSASGASNLSMRNTRILEQANDRLAALGLKKDIPLELITASGSGLDPHLSPDAVYAQIPRIAKARKMSETELKELVDSYVEAPLLGVIGMHQVNVLKLNLALDKP